MKTPISLLAVGISLASQCQATPIDFASTAANSVKYFFVFGNSYSTTGFNPTLEQPNPGNPLGNPAYPGDTTSNGPNWVDFLTTTYNQSYVQTYNFAERGATLDAEIVPPASPAIMSVLQQINTVFIPKYGGKPSTAPWSADDSLFAFFIGINDINNSDEYQNDQLFTNLFTSYSRLVKSIYDLGARNFLFINVPPFDQSPASASQGVQFQSRQIAAIHDFNLRLTEMAMVFQGLYEGARAHQFDLHTLFTEVLDDPTSYPETSGYKNMTDYCVEYEGYESGMTDTMYASSPACGVPANQYFWLDSLHPTFPIHNVTAQKIAELVAQ